MSSLMGKYQIAANPASLADGDSIASYLVSAAGSLITSTSVSGKEYVDTKLISDYLDGDAWTGGVSYLNAIGVVDNMLNWTPLKLNASGELPVAATVNFAGDYPEDSPHADGDVGLFNLAVRRDSRDSGVDTDGDYASFNVNAVGELWVKDADSLAELVLIKGDTASIASSASSIDSQLGDIYTEQLDQGTTLDSILTNTGTIATNTGTTATNTGTIATTLSALSKAEDAVHSSGDQGIQALAVRKDSQGSNAADGDYTSLLTWSEGSLKVVDVANGSILQSQVSVTDTAAQVPASNLANRKSLMLQNTGDKTIYIGSATVTTSGATAGIELPAKSFIELEVGPAVNVFAVKNGATGNNLNVLQLA